MRRQDRHADPEQADARRAVRLDASRPTRSCCAERWRRGRTNDDPIDLAVLGGLQDEQALQAYQVAHFQPFDPVHKRTEATVKGADGTRSR